MFDQLGIEWKVIEERIIAVVSDGAGTMGAYVGLMNNVREKGGRELIGWVKDAAHCLVRAISTAKGKVKLWYDALDDLVSFLACFYSTSSKRMRGLWRKGGEVLFLPPHWCALGGSNLPRAGYRAREFACCCGTLARVH